MRSFGSDNNSGVHPEIMNAIVAANTEHTIGYGDDKWTDAATAKIKEIFGETASPFFVFNGTGANCVALQCTTRSYHSIIAARSSHINQDECGAPQKMSGCALTPIDTADGKLTWEMIEPHLGHVGFCHHSQPKVVYISQTTELGTVYTLEEVKNLANQLHKHGMYLHMDGARIANACAQLGCTLKEATVDLGIDILSFGGTKNGMMMGEAVISFREELTDSIQYFRKQSAQLSSKMRYLSAQYIPYLSNNLWLYNATAANNAAMQLYNVLKQYPQVKFTQKVESNQLFFTIPAQAIERLQQDYFFYIWNEQAGEVRLVTSWDTSADDISKFELSLSRIFG